MGLLAEVAVMLEDDDVESAGKEVWGKSRPVIRDVRERTARLRQRIARDTRAGRLCQDKTRVPQARTILCVVRMRNGGRVRINQMGVKRRMRMNSVVKAGRVVAAVAVVWVLKKSVSRRRGSSRMLQRAVNVCKVSRISSRLFLCLSWSEPPRLCVFFFSPVRIVLESGL